MKNKQFNKTNNWDTGYRLYPFFYMKNLIIDSNNYFYRGVVPFGASHDKDAYTIVYNFFKNLRATVEYFQPNSLFFPLEGHPIHRYSLYPEYKANRIVKTASSKERFYEESRVIIDLLKFLPCTVVHHPKFEADDIIFTLVKDLHIDQNIVVSTDEDYYQLLELPSVKVFNPKDKSFLEMNSKYSIVRKSLVGDKSDNIPRLLSDRKADALLSDSDSFKEYLEDEEHLEDFNINYQLIKFHDVPMDEMSIEYNCFDLDALVHYFEKYKFKSLLKPEYLDTFKVTFENICLQPDDQVH